MRLFASVALFGGVLVWLCDGFHTQRQLHNLDISRAQSFSFLPHAEFEVTGPGCLSQKESRPTSKDLSIKTYDDVKSLLPTVGHESFETKPHYTCLENKSPKKIHVILADAHPADDMVSKARSLADKNPTWTLYLWLEGANDDLKKGFPSNTEVRDLRDWYSRFKLADVAQGSGSESSKIHLLRLDVLHAEGGIFVDLATTTSMVFDDFGDVFTWPFVVFNEDAKTLSNEIFGFEQGSMFLDYVMKLAEEHCIFWHGCDDNGGVGSNFLAMAALEWHDPDLNWIFERRDAQSTTSSTTTMTATTSTTSTTIAATTSTTSTTTTSTGKETQVPDEGSTIRGGDDRVYKIDRELGAGYAAKVFSGRLCKSSSLSHCDLVGEELAFKFSKGKNFLKAKQEEKWYRKIQGPLVFEKSSSEELRKVDSITPLLDGFTYEDFYVLVFPKADVLPTRMKHLDDIKCLAKDVLNAFVKIHSLDIVHWDVKLSNVLFYNKHFILSDFGAAKDFGDNPPLSYIGECCLAPWFDKWDAEKFVGDSHNIAFQDIFALFSMLYHAAYGHFMPDVPKDKLIELWLKVPGNDKPVSQDIFIPSEFKQKPHALEQARAFIEFLANMIVPSSLESKHLATAADLMKHAWLSDAVDGRICGNSDWLHEN